jgi:outer membrane protein assembly factor BamB
VTYERLLKRSDVLADEGRLERCCRALIDLDSQHGRARACLEQLEVVRSARRVQRQQLIPYVVALLLTALVAGGVIFAVLALGQRQELERRVNSELDERLSMVEELRAGARWSAVFDEVRSLAREFPANERVALLELPLRVSSEPEGFELWVNGRRAESTASEDGELAGFSPSETELLIELRAPAGRVVWSARPGVESFIERRVVVTEEPAWSYMGEADHDVRPAYCVARERWVVPARDGRVYFLGRSGALLGAALELGEYGDRLTAPRVDGEQAFIGLSAGGVAAIDIGAARVEHRFEAGGPVSGVPVVSGDRVAFGSLDGHLRIYDRAGPLVLAVRTGNEQRFAGCLVQGGSAAVFVGQDGYARRLDLEAGRESALQDLGRAPASAPALCAEGVVVLFEDGELAVISPDLASPPRFAKLTGGRVTSFAVDDEGIYLASKGSLFALDPASLEERWRLDTEALREPGPRPRLACHSGRLLFSPGNEKLYAYGAGSGALIWQARLGDSGVASDFGCAGGFVVVGLRGLAVVQVKVGYE